MKSAYKIILGLFLAVASIAAAADVAPFYFKDLGNYFYTDLTEDEASAIEAQSQEYWEELVKYKVFGAHGIKFAGDNISFSDTAGRFGTAAGNFEIDKNSVNHYVGGAVMIGGDMTMGYTYDTLSSGPVRVTGDIIVDNSNWYGSVKGYHCVSGSVSDRYSLFLNGSYVFSGEDYSSCPSSRVPEVNSKLTVPLLYKGLSMINWQKFIANEIFTIDVPPGEGAYDFHIQWIAFYEQAVLLVRMPKGGRLTRIYADKDNMNGETIDFFSATSAQIRVVYMDDDAEWDEENGKWKNEVHFEKSEDGYPIWSVEGATVVSNRDYRGDLLFYTPTDLYLNRLSSTDTLQGTFISAGKIVLGENLTLAGQLIADSIIVNANFKGSNFRYVPFDPPMYSVPKLTAGGVFVENGKDVVVPVELSSKAKTEVVFNYCFDVEGENAAEGYAAIHDFNITKNALFPICGNGAFMTAIINKGTTEPTSATKIYVNVAEDEIDEADEILKLKIYDLSGAVLEDGGREGTFNLTVADVSAKPSFVADNVSHYDIEENSPTGTLIAKFYIKNATDPKELLLATGYQYFGSSIPNAADLFDAEIVTSAAEPYVAITVDNAYLLDYESVADSFRVTVTLKDQEGTKLDAITRIIRVVDVNEAPVIDAKKVVETIEIPENSISGSSVLMYDVSDVDAGDASTLKVMYKVLESNIKNGTNFKDLFNVTYNASLQKIFVSVKDEKLLDYEDLRRATSRDDPDPQIKVSIVVQDAGGLKDSVVRIIDITDVNEVPVLLDDVIDVSEDALPGTILDTVEAVDVDSLSKYGILRYALVGGDTALFAISSSGVLTLKESLDYEYENKHQVLVQVDDGDNFVMTVFKINVVDVKETSEVVITEYSDKDSTWLYPDTIYTHQKKGTITWMQDGDIVTKDTTLWNDKCILVISYRDPSTNYAGKDTVVIFYTEEIVDTTKTEPVEVDTTKTEPAKNDSTKTSPKGPKIDSNPAMQDVYMTISAVALEKVVLDENPENGVKLNTIKGKGIEVSYEDKKAGVDVTVSYMIDGNGNIKTKTITDDSGNKVSAEVITVSYETEIDGKDVTISYQAVAETGEILAEDASGNLMTVQASKKKSNMGYYIVSYEETDEDGDVTKVSYMVDDRGNIVKNSFKNGDKKSDDENDDEEDGEEIFAEPSFRIEMTGPFQFTIVMEESLASLKAANSKFAVMDLQGRVIRKGRISTAETVVPRLRKGSYIVRVGLRTRRVNLY